MKTILTILLTIFTIQTYALEFPRDSAAKQIQDSLYNPSWILSWNEGNWLKSMTIPFGVSDEIKTELLSKTTKQWTNEAFGTEPDVALRAKSALGVKYLYGIGAEQSTELGLSYLKIAADGGRVGSALYLAQAYAGGAGGTSPDFIEALKWYKLASNLDKDKKYAFDLSYIHMWAAEQATVRKNYKQAVELYKEALEYGNKDAAAYLVTLYTAGLGVDKDNDKALEYAKLLDPKKLLANKENFIRFSSKLSPETIVGLLHINISRIQNNSEEYQQARLTLDKSVQNKDPIGAYIAHKIAYEAKDYKYAAYAIDIAAKGELPEAQYELAQTYERIDVFPFKSFNMYEQSANSGYGKAYSKYASKLYDKQEYKDAFKWLNKAIKYESEINGDGNNPYIGVASDGYLESVEKLAKMYIDGNGVEKNKDKAVELISNLIKQVEGRIKLTEVQANPNIKREKLIFNTLDEQMKFFNDKLKGYVYKKYELQGLKDAIGNK